MKIKAKRNRIQEKYKKYLSIYLSIYLSLSLGSVQKTSSSSRWSAIELSFDLSSLASVRVMAKKKNQTGNVAKSIETVRISRKLERFLTINGADSKEEKNILPFSSVVIPEEVFKRYDLSEKDLASLAPGYCYSYKQGFLDKLNVTE